MAELKVKVTVNKRELGELERDIKRLQKEAAQISIKFTSIRNIVKETEQLANALKKAETAAKDRAKAEADLEARMQKRATTDAKLAKEETKQTQAIQKIIQDLIKLAREEERTTQSENRLAAQQEQTRRKMMQTGDAASNLTAKLKGMFTAFSMANIVSSGVNMALSTIRSAVRDALNEMKELDTAITHYRQVTGASDLEGQAMISGAYSVASKYGTSAADYMESVATYARAGYGDVADELAELSMKTQIVGQTTSEIADQFLLTMDAAYQYEGSVSKLSKVLDGASKIDSTYATTIEKIAAGLGLVAPLANQVHTSEAELTAAIGTITAVTQRSGAESARALRSLFLNILGDTTTEIEEGVTATEESVKDLQGVLNKYASSAVEAARATGQVINPMEAIGALSKSMKEGILSEAELMDMLSSLGGKLRVSQLVALVANWDMYTEMLGTYQDSIGSADEKTEIYLESWDAKLNVLKNTWVEFVSKTVDSDWIKNLISGITKLIKSFGDLGTAIKLIGGIFGGVKIATSLSSGLNALSNSFAKMTTAAAKAGDMVKMRVGTIGGVVSDVGAKVASVTGGIIAAISAVALAYNTWKENRIQAAIEQRDKAIELAETEREEAQLYAEKYEEYTHLQSAYDQGIIDAEAYETAVLKIAEALGLEGEAIDTIIAKLKEKAVAEAEDAVSSTQTALAQSRAAAIEQLTKVSATYNPIRSAYADTPNVRDLGWEAPDPNWTNEDRLNAAVKTYRSLSIDAQNALTQYNKYVELSKKKTNEFWTAQDQASAKATADSWLKKYTEYTEQLEPYNDTIGKMIELEDQLYEAEENLSNVELGEFGADGAESALAGITTQTEEAAKEFDTLANSIASAETALENYQKQTQEEKTDNYKNYAAAWKKAYEDIQKGWRNSNAVNAAIDLFFSGDTLLKLHKQGIEAADVIASDFWKEIFTYTDDSGNLQFIEGADAGSNFAYALYDLVNAAEDSQAVMKQLGVSFEEVDGALSMTVDDVDATAEAMWNLFGIPITGDMLATILESLSVFDTQSRLTAEDVNGLAYSLNALNEDGQVDLAKLIHGEMALDKPNEEIIDLLANILELKENGEVQLSVSDEELNTLITTLEEEIKDREASVTYEDNADEVVEDAQKVDIEVKKTVNGNPYKITYTVNENEVVNSLKHINEEAKRTQQVLVATVKPHQNAKGTRNDPGGLSVVNEEGAELIIEGDTARIAGNGHPTLTYLEQGANVYTAKETEAILGGTVADALYDGINAYAGGTRSGITRYNPNTGGTGTTTSDVYAGTYTPGSDYTPTDLSGATNDEESLETLKDRVSLLKSELGLMEAQGKSIDEQAAKQYEIKDALKEEHEWLMLHGGSQEEINKLMTEELKVQAAIDKLYTDAEAERVKGEEEAAKAEEERLSKEKQGYEDKISLAESELDLLESWERPSSELIEKNEEIANLYTEEIKWLHQNGASQEEINKKLLQREQVWANIRKIREADRNAEAEAEKAAQEKAEKKFKHTVEWYEKKIGLAESEYDLMEAQGASVEKQVAKQKEISEWILREINYLKKNGGDQEEINRLMLERISIAQKISEIQTQSAEEEKQKEKEKQDHFITWYQKNVSLRKSELSLIEAQDGSVKKQIQKQREISDWLRKQINYLQKIGGHEEEVNQLLAERAGIEKNISSLNKGLLDELASAVSNKIDKLNATRDKYVEQIQARIDKLKEERDAQKKANEEEKKHQELVEAWRKLRNVQNERTVRQYNAKTGQWEWVASAKDVQSAQAAYDKAKESWQEYKADKAYEAKIAKLEAQQEHYTNLFAEKTDKWQKILDSMEEPITTIAKALKNIENNATKDMRGDINDLNKLLKPLGYRISTKKLYDSGGILSGIGGIKGTTSDEMVLPPDVTEKLLKPAQPAEFKTRMNELRYLYGANASGIAGNTLNTIGSQHNGDIYTYGNITLTESQARTTTIYDLVQASRGLRAYNGAM